MSLEWVYYVATTACILQVASYLFAFARTGHSGSLRFGVPAFALFGAAFAMLQISIGDAPRVARADLVIPLRLCFLVGSLLWIAEQAVYVRRFLRVVRG